MYKRQSLLSFPRRRRHRSSKDVRKHLARNAAAAARTSRSSSARISKDIVRALCVSFVGETTSSFDGNDDLVFLTLFLAKNLTLLLSDAFFARSVVKLSLGLLLKHTLQTRIILLVNQFPLFPRIRVRMSICPLLHFKYTCFFTTHSSNPSSVI